MGRTSAIPACDEGNGRLYETMLKYSTEQRTYVLSSAILAPTQTMPTREELIDAFMSIATYRPTIDSRGHAVFGDPYWPTRAEAERAVDCATGGATAASENSDPVHSEPIGAQFTLTLKAS